MIAMFGAIGFIGVLVSLMIIIIQSIRKRPKKKAVLALLAFITISAVCIAIPSNDKTTIDNPLTVSSNETPLADANETPKAEMMPDETQSSDGSAIVITASPTPTVTPKVYVEDKVVNQFMTEYDTITSSPITDIRNGHIRTKYYFYSYGFYIEIINATEAAAEYVSVSIHGSQESHVPEMRDVFHDITKTLDPGLTDNEIYVFFDNSINTTNSHENLTLGKLTCNVHPIGDFSGNGRIDIHT